MLGIIFDAPMNPADNSFSTVCTTLESFRNLNTELKYSEMILDSKPGLNVEFELFFFFNWMLIRLTDQL